jgi:hypothetical protein
MDRNHLAGRAGDAANAVLAAVGYNFRLLLAWLAALLCLLLRRALRVTTPTAAQIRTCTPFTRPDPRSSRSTNKKLDIRAIFKFERAYGHSAPTLRVRWRCMRSRARAPGRQRPDAEHAFPRRHDRRRVGHARGQAACDPTSAIGSGRTVDSALAQNRRHH